MIAPERAPAQQAAFDRFQTIYNDQRPHEALAMKTPAEVYERSSRQLPEKPPEHSYPERFESRRVRRNGGMKWGGKHLLVGEARAGERSGRRPSTMACGTCIWARRDSVCCTTDRA